MVAARIDSRNRVIALISREVFRDVRFGALSQRSVPGRERHIANALWSVYQGRLCAVPRSGSPDRIAIGRRPLHAPPSLPALERDEGFQVLGSGRTLAVEVL